MAQTHLKERPKAETDAVRMAKEYVNQQLAIMKRFGSAPKLSQQAYEELVQRVVLAAK
jgi:hypothetical protein